ncbi:uncharacterized protein KY384_005825 [Bacidia gigantensis]|uniref:uncharacterized protein n=1 Tax=Bacidia gigantensis TaxID=2732470 RepID=UPI001D05A3B0|nr:uncharacterized protein KY384_005825 [Bacidia gigantensis]KAG8529190.1 hypothetical protein KY384_005825 [Bacidia gigantensis]
MDYSSDSFGLRVCIDGLGYLKILAPPEKILRWIEGKLNLLGRLPHYVSIDQKTYGRYGVLPTANAPAGSSPNGGVRPTYLVMGLLTSKLLSIVALALTTLATNEADFEDFIPPNELQNEEQLPHTLSNITALLPRAVGLVKGDDKKIYGGKVGTAIDGLKVFVYAQPGCTDEKQEIDANVYSQNVAPEFKGQGNAIHSFSLSRELNPGEVIDFSSKGPAKVNMSPPPDQKAPAPPPPKQEQGTQKDDKSDINIYYMENAVFVNRNAAKDAKPFGTPDDTKVGSGKHLKRGETVWTDDDGNSYAYLEEEIDVVVDGDDDDDDDKVEGGLTGGDAGKGVLDKRGGPDMTAGLAQCALFFGSWDKGKIKQECVDLKGAANCFRIWLPQ